MKSLIFKILLLISAIFLSLTLYQNRNKNQVRKQDVTTENNTVIPTGLSPTTAELINTSTTIFVPYWTLDNEVTKEKGERLFYFGISANTAGINTDEPGYKNVSRFASIVGESKETYLTLRMLDTKTNIAILEDPELQQKVIRETVEIAKSNGFEGIVLDLELSVIPFDSVTKNINDFVARFDTELNKQDVPFAVAIYGDAFYRARPFDVKYIAQHSDEIVVMAYDFSKSYGEPGPNFPFTGKDNYGYDFQTMIDDYQKIVPAEKLTITMGMFGYEWELGKDGKPLKGAESLTVHQARSRYLNGCTFSECSVNRDPQTKETVVRFKDESGDAHEVWFDDEQSVAKKIEFLRKRGISGVGYWAYGYY